MDTPIPLLTPWRPDDPDTATLDEVLAFLDSCSDSSLLSDPSSYADDTGSDATTAADSDAQRSTKNAFEQQQDACTGRKRKKTSVDAEKPKRPPRHRTNRKRLRPEILQLRQLIVDLEARLTCLQRVRERGGAQPVSVAAMLRSEAAGQPDASANAYENAVEEYRQLQRAQQRNLDLRQALVDQAAAHEELQRLFAQNLSPKDLHFLCGIRSEGVPAGMLGGERVYMYLEIHLLASKVFLLLVWAISNAAAARGMDRSMGRNSAASRGFQGRACGSALRREGYVEPPLCESGSFYYRDAYAF